ncbi:hypothetical protein RYX36_028727, partial [Vicia faba]
TFVHLVVLSKVIIIKSKGRILWKNNRIASCNYFRTVRNPLDDYNLGRVKKLWGLRQDYHILFPFYRKFKNSFPLEKLATEKSVDSVSSRVMDSSINQNFVVFWFYVVIPTLVDYFLRNGLRWKHNCLTADNNFSQSHLSIMRKLGPYYTH